MKVMARRQTPICFRLHWFATRRFNDHLTASREHTGIVTYTEVLHSIIGALLPGVARSRQLTLGPVRLNKHALNPATVRHRRAL